MLKSNVIRLRCCCSVVAFSDRKVRTEWKIFFEPAICHGLSVPSRSYRFLKPSLFFGCTVRNKEVLLRFKEQRNILHEISKQNANCISHILRRNGLLQQIIEGKIKGGMVVPGRRGRRRRKLLDDLKEKRGYSHLKEEALNRTMRRTRF
jgi:chorismate mutase